jgi:hypothetical protein
VGRLLGDPEVWDDTPARPRPVARGLAGLAAGAVAGLLPAFAVVPRPDPPPPEVRLPPAGSDRRVLAQNVRARAVVGATHDPEVVELCDRVVRLVDGRPLELTPGDVGGPAA